MCEHLNYEDLDEFQWEYLYRALHRRRVAAIGLYLLYRQRRKGEHKRRLWVRRWIERRQEGRGSLHLLQNELRLQDTESYRKYLRMDENVFEELLERITPRIQRQDTIMRQAIPPRQRLIATLRFLASGNTYEDLSYSLRLPKCTLSLLIPDTLQAIAAELQDECIKFPSSKTDWEDVEQHYRILWNFPHCVGAIDGKHINFRPARSSGSLYRNCKGRDSIVLLALVDACYKFLYVDIGRNGRMNDAAVFRESEFGQLLLQNSIDFPDPEPLPGYDANVKMPFIITGDDAFPLGTNLMKPYPERGLTNEQRIFNYRLSRARRVVENAFGSLANRFRILLTTIALPVQNDRWCAASYTTLFCLESQTSYQIRKALILTVAQVISFVLSEISHTREETITLGQLKLFAIILRNILTVMGPFLGKMTPCEEVIINTLEPESCRLTPNGRFTMFRLIHFKDHSNSRNQIFFQLTFACKFCTVLLFPLSSLVSNP